MKSFNVIHFLLGILTVATLAACGQGPSSMVGTDAIAAAGSMAVNEEDDRIYVFAVKQNRRLEVYSETHGSEGELRLKHGDTVNILDLEKQSDGTTWAQVAIDRDETSNVDDDTNIYWVPLMSLANNDFVPVIDEDPYDENGEELAEIDEIVNINPLLAKAKKKGKVRRVRKMTYCYRYVKARLLKMGLVKIYLPGVSAYSAATTLPKHGFRKTGRGRNKARTNDVCVYSGGNGGNGHIEIKVAGGWWYGYGVKPDPISLNGRKLITCFYK